MALSTKHQVFVNEYLISWNSADAARRAGYNGKSNVVGPRLLADVSIQAEIAQRLKEKQLTADAVLSRLSEMAFSNMSDFVDIQTKADLADARERGYLIKKFKRKITHTESGEMYEDIELELYDSQSALINIGKQHGLFSDKVELKLTKEIDAILDTLESNLDADTYQRVLQALSAGNDNGPTSASPTE
jgi:hypothetical protein